MMKRTLYAALALSLLTGSGLAMAQDVPASPAPGMADAPCPSALTRPPSVEALAEAMIRPGPADIPAMLALTQQPDYQAYAAAKAAQDARDWAGVCIYRAANAAVLAGQMRPDIVLMGDSITENWARAEPAMFQTGRIAGRGVSGQTSAQMLVRFRADVVALRPRVVHILAGTNDIAGNAGVSSPDAYKNNIMTMVDLARANGIQVILGAMPPADRFFWQPTLRPAEKINELNAWLRAYAAEKQIAFIDYHAALADEAGGMRRELSVDGVHPNRDAYAIMDRLFLTVSE